MNAAPSPAAGRLIVITGCMFAGKTTRLIERLTGALTAGRRVLAIKHSDDTRYDPQQLATHDGRVLPCRPLADTGAISAAAAAFDVLGIDEAHFFGRGLPAVCAALTARGKDVLVAGIDHDAWGRPFPPLPELRSAASDVELLTAPCGRCGEPARYSQRLTPVRATSMVGGAGEYEPRCAACFEPLPPPAPAY